MSNPKPPGDVKMAAAKTELALRLGRLFRRQPDTLWMEKEIRQFKKLFKQGCFKNPDDLTLIEQYYAYERRQPTGYHRRKLAQFLNNFMGELDAAREWRERHPLKKPERKIIPLPLLESSEPALIPQTQEEIEAHKRFMLDFAQRKASKGGA